MTTASERIEIVAVSRTYCTLLATKNMEAKIGVELKEETLTKLRKQLGREPTDAEVRAARDELLRRHYAAMLTTGMMLRDEADEFSLRASK